METEFNPAPVVIVTGASSGIGKALAHRLASGGSRLVLHTGSNGAALERVHADVNSQGAEAISLVGDLTDPAMCTGLVHAAVERFGGIDGIVSNAGFPDLTPLEDLDDERFRHSFDAMPAAFLRIMRAAAPYLEQSPAGRVIAVSSFVAHRFVMNGDNFMASAAAKAALEGLVRSLAERFADKGVTINAVAPGYIRKDREADAPLEDASNARRGMGRVAMGRIGLPEEVAAAIEFFLSRDASYVTGQTLHVDGGITL